MDGESFDRLSVVVDRLRNRSTRREALLAILGGAFAGIAGTSSDDAAAKNRNRNRKNCRGYGGRCDRNNDCCDGRCINGYCYYTGNGGGGHNNNNCGGRVCTNGWRCCKQNGISVCVPQGYPTCCGNYSYTNGYSCCNHGHNACYGGGRCCPGAGGTGCCQSGWKCCGNGRCCPDGWRCGNIACYAYQDAGLSAESVASMPFQDAVPPDEADRVYIGDQIPGEFKP